MSGRKSLSIDAEVFGRLQAHKRGGESWSDVLDRAADALEADETASGDGGHTTSTHDPLTEEHIDDIAAKTARRTADEVENRLTTR